MDGGFEIERLAVTFLTETGQDIASAEFPGDRHSAPIPLREIARRALALDARKVVIRHNHPSGDASPSRADVAATRRLVAALDLIGVSVHDHVISAGDQNFSFRSAGLI